MNLVSIYYSQGMSFPLIVTSFVGSEYLSRATQQIYPVRKLILGTITYSLFVHLWISFIIIFFPLQNPYLAAAAAQIAMVFEENNAYW